MYVIALEGVRDADLSDMSDQINRAARMAINKAAERGRGWFAQDMRKQVAFPSGYLGAGANRLFIERKASDQSLEAVVAARRRPTSLARFATGNKSKQARGVHVQVKPGRTRLMQNAFLMNLRSGNLGLAMRTRPGQRPPKAFKPKEIQPGLWLLYGPSVDQVFRQMIEKEDRPYGQVEDFLATEFERLIDLNL